MYKRIPENIHGIVKDLNYQDKKIEALVQEAISEIK
jgi:hypothetical protein